MLRGIWTVAILNLSGEEVHREHIQLGIITVESPQGGYGGVMS